MLLGQTYKMRIATLLFAALAAISSLNAATFVGTGLGAIPNGTSAICTPGSSTLSAPLDVSFFVTGMTAPLTDIRVTLNFSPKHTWSGDLVVSLIAANGVTEHPLFGRVGGGSTGDSSDLEGPYTFVDPAFSSANFWTAAADALSTASIAAGTYPTTAVPDGVNVVTEATPPTQFLATFAALSTEALNGTWKLRFVDHCLGDVGTVSSATLELASGPPPAANQYSVSPTALNFGLQRVNTGSSEQYVSIFAPASNGNTVGFAGGSCTISGADSTMFQTTSSAHSVSAGATQQIPVRFKPSSSGAKSATLTCLNVMPSGTLPASFTVQLSGEGGTPAPQPNCYDIDGDGVQNALIDGLFITRLQLGFSPSHAAAGIAFNSPRGSTKAVLGFMREQCGWPGISVP